MSSFDDGLGVLLSFSDYSQYKIISHHLKCNASYVYMSSYHICVNGLSYVVEIPSTKDSSSISSSNSHSSSAADPESLSNAETISLSDAEQDSSSDIGSLSTDVDSESSVH